MLRLVALLLLTLSSACSVSPERLLFSLDLPGATKQVILCTTDDWQDSTATVRCLERKNGGWQVVVPKQQSGLTQPGEQDQPGRLSFPANVGRSGLGWGLGMHVDGAGPKKREGDGRAPAGIFSLGTAFGYAATPPAGMTVPYRQATDRDYFVDAPAAPAYNQWQHIPAAQANDPTSRWASCERMRRDDALYEWGMVVNHNTRPVVPGRGSAIFLHVWLGAGKPTSGCTSMSRSDLLRVMAWLRADATPLLVQMPVGELAALRRRY